MARLGFTEPTPVQRLAIPAVLEGRDAVVRAKTGSGKTLAFGLPLLTMVPSGKGKPTVLIVLPTRELALQVRDAIESVAQGSPLRLTPVFGGVGLEPQERALRQGTDIVVGTPGRLKDLLGRGSLDLSHVSILVLDEADQMLDMGFRRDIEFLVGRLPARQQTILFSATMPDPIRQLADRYLKDPVNLEAQSEERIPARIVHQMVRVDRGQRVEALWALLASDRPGRTIIFTQMKHETRRVAQKLERCLERPVGFLNGNMSQAARNTMLARFKSGEIDVLVATDVAARGLDIEGVDLVLHHGVPTTVETYIHRSGRTGRAGREGTSVLLVTHDDHEAYHPIAKRVAIQERPMPPLPGPMPASAPDERSRGDRPPAPRGGRPVERRGVQPAGAPRGGQASADQVWKVVRLRLSPLPEQNPKRLVQWLAKRTGIAAHELRGLSIMPDHVRLEVAASRRDAFLSRLAKPARSGSRGA
ncbi:MAG: DEAD/DEAH box helicase [Candidatus Sericytochromatia bacterium]|nr:DEAD/DEAH box helicase [Candidatus Sericytochromatia bacterium]